MRKQKGNPMIQFSCPYCNTRFADTDPGKFKCTVCGNMFRVSNASADEKSAFQNVGLPGEKAILKLLGWG